jgi:hypothetical protein
MDQRPGRASGPPPTWDELEAFPAARNLGVLDQVLSYPSVGIYLRSAPADVTGLLDADSAYQACVTARGRPRRGDQPVIFLALATMGAFGRIPEDVRRDGTPDDVLVYAVRQERVPCIRGGPPPPRNAAARPRRELCLSVDVIDARTGDLLASFITNAPTDGFTLAPPHEHRHRK